MNKFLGNVFAVLGTVILVASSFVISPLASLFGGLKTTFYDNWLGTESLAIKLVKFCAAIVLIPFFTVWYGVAGIFRSFASIPSMTKTNYDNFMA